MPVDTTLYDLLDVSPNAADAQIKKNYRKLAKEYHPDKNSSNDSDEKFKEITFAYETLTDPQKRAMYDRFGLDAVRERDSGPSAGFDDVFGHFFGGGGGGGGHPFDEIFGGGSPFGGFGGFHGGRGRTRRGKDVLHPLKVTLEDLYKGKTSKIQLNKTVICKKCNGQGGKNGASSTCQDCRGRGIVIKVRQLGPGMVQQMQSQCSACNGQGTTISEKDKCKTCSGRKVMKETKILEVPVEKGMKHEQRIKFQGEGDQDPGVEPGDVVIVLSEQPHELFDRKGDNLIYNMKVSLSEALCGFDRVIKHLDGRQIVVSCQPGQVTKPGSLYVVSQEGMPQHRNPYTKGDLYVACDVEFPENLTEVAELEKLLPARPSEEVPADAEEVDMMSFDPDEAGDHHNHGGHAAGGESDSDDDMGGPRVQQCATG